ncbi:MAG: cyclic nucleotide-binding domain-containing protein [Bdellovibrionales bacterium]
MSFRRQLYMVFMIFSAFALGVWLPVRVVFIEPIWWLDLTVDVWIMSLVGAEIVYNRNFTWKNLDLIAALPLITASHALGGADFGILLFFKMIFTRKVMYIREITDAHDGMHPVLARLLPMIFVIPIVVHGVACGWVWLGSGTVGPADDRFFDYCRAVYWTLTTLTTVGYGDISAKTLPQMAYASMTMVIGVAFFGYVQSNVASLLARMDSAREEYLSLLDRVEAFMRYNQVPTEIRSKIRAYYRYIWESRKGYDDSLVLGSLPTKLRAEVSLHLNAEIIEKVPILKGADQDCLQDIVLQLKPLVVVPGEKIFHAGEPGDAMYFIHRGPVEIVSLEGKILATLQPGSFFGEMALLTTNPRTATARAADYCDLFVLSREAFEKVLDRYPQFSEHIREVARQRVA